MLERLRASYLLSAVQNRFGVHPVLVNSLPKSGTNLMVKVVRSIPGLSFRDAHLGHSTVKKWAGASSSTITVPVGIDSPVEVPLHNVEAALDRIKASQFISSHLPYSPELAHTLDQKGFRILLLIRDPRDVVLSHANYISKSPGHHLHALYESATQEEAVMYSITGYEDDAVALTSIGERYRNYMEWYPKPACILVHFEQLVGPKGGGDEQEQRHQLRRIAQHIGARWSKDDLRHAANNLYGGTKTFSKGRGGQVRSWEGAFSPAHTDALKHEVGDLLIELGYEQDHAW